jgi:hypothetical protein
MITLDFPTAFPPSAQLIPDPFPDQKSGLPPVTVHGFCANAWTYVSKQAAKK